MFSFCGMHRAEETDPDSRPGGSHRERGRETCMYDAGMGSWGEKEEEEEVVAH